MVKRPKKITLGKKLGGKKNNSNNQTGKVESLIIFRCNCRCLMCSTGLQIDRSRHDTDYHAIRPFEDVKKDIDKAANMNARGFAFSGGEPTLRNDLPELAAYAREKNLGHIEVQSNGRMYIYKKLCQKLIDSGVNRFVVSLHSHQEKIHDRIMGTKGTFKQAVQGIKNLNELGQKVNINVVLIKPNYQHLAQHVKFLIDNFDIGEIRLTMSMIEGSVARNPRALIPKMSDVGPHICRAIDIIKKSEKNIGCFVYNMVPCLVPGHEENINDMGQLDTLLIGPEFESSLDESRRGKKIKSASCRLCLYDDRCYGIWRSYASVFGLDELKPIKKPAQKG
ncbi:MAG: Radical SAM domain protein [Parcubacteria group bacterium GW2011_GWA2_42_11]|nr:MAG: Radical SAM domain protein [Parcubacteria group bacterium GW2011_GWA2_42_11]